MRVRVIDVECSEATVTTVLAALGAIAPAPAPVVREFTAIAAPAAAPQTRPQKAQRAPRAAQPAAEDKEPGTSPLALVKQALASGPQSQDELLSWIHSNGMPGYRAARLRGLLSYQVKRGRFKRSGDHLNGIWRLA